MKTYEVELITVPKHGQYWIVRGLPTNPDLLEFRQPDSFAKQIGIDETQDTILILVGHNHSCNSAGSIFAGVFSCLYDEYQCNPALKDGDKLHIAKTTARTHHSYDETSPEWCIPEITLECNGVQVQPVNDSCPTVEQLERELAICESIERTLERFADSFRGADKWRVQDALFRATSGL